MSALPASFYGGFAAAGYPHSITEVRPALGEPYQVPLEAVASTAVPVAQTDSLPYSFAGGTGESCMIRRVVCVCAAERSSSPSS